MPKVTWADVKKGDRVELAGKTWDVVRAKAKGKKVDVTIVAGNRTAASTVKASDKVKKLKPPPLRDASNAQQRWATKSEVEKTLGKPEKKSKKPPTTPPAKPGKDPWETPRDRIEAKLDELLSARLVGEANDASAGYYVPPVDVTTVAAHLVMFHNIDPSPYANEAAMLDVHREAHVAALAGEVKLTMNHWHTKTRPDIAT